MTELQKVTSASDLPLHYISQLCKAAERYDNLDDTVAHYVADIATTA